MYPVTVSCDTKGSIYIGAANRNYLRRENRLGAESALFGSQLNYLVSAQIADGTIILTTRRGAKEIGATILYRYRALRNDRY